MQYVNFPVTDPRYKNSGENGLYVSLVVEDDEITYTNWARLEMCNVYVGSDRGDAHDYHFPRIDKMKYDDALGEANWLYDILSRPYKHVILLDSHSWTGYNHEEGHYFVCTYNDLTPEGKALYDEIQQSHGGRVSLITWLDT